jgi:hypothetical protein
VHAAGRDMHAADARPPRSRPYIAGVAGARPWRSAVERALSLSLFLLLRARRLLFDQVFVCSKVGAREGCVCEGCERRRRCVDVRSRPEGRAFLLSRAASASGIRPARRRRRRRRREEKRRPPRPCPALSLSLSSIPRLVTPQRTVRVSAHTLNSSSGALEPKGTLSRSRPKKEGRGLSSLSLSLERLASPAWTRIPPENPPTGRRAGTVSSSALVRVQEWALSRARAGSGNFESLSNGLFWRALSLPPLRKHSAERARAGQRQLA